MEECCLNCRRRLKLVMFDYSHGGCEHHDVGYACTLFAEEGQIIWMVGKDHERCICEGYKPKALNVLHKEREVAW